ncbi:MAG TPA: LysR family transcriptional regulator [Lachnospiraceae bacterium]|nr:LysR family transcriptional regulator [Lachnospiraceae bacterium]
MDLKQLNTFLTLSKIRNYTKTAATLGYAQSSITAQIQQLEKELGTKLFECIGKKVMLTSQGNALIPYATKILSLSMNMKESISNSDTMCGSITIGASESLCIYRLPAIIKAYKEKHPNIDIFLKLLNCNEFVPFLSDNSIDIAFTIGDRIDNESITTIIELPEPIMILASPEHHLSSIDKLSLRDFDKESFILTEHGCCYRGAFEKDLLNANVDFEIVLETGSIQAIKQTTMINLGICVLPEISVTEEIQRKMLIPLAYENNYPIVSQIIHHKNKWMSPLLRDFIQEASSRWVHSKHFLI